MEVQPAGATAPPGARRWWSLTGRLVLWAGSGVTWLVTGTLVLVSPLFLLNDAGNASDQVAAAFQLVAVTVLVSLACGVMLVGARRSPWARVGLMVAGWGLVALAAVHLGAVQHAA